MVLVVVMSRVVVVKLASYLAFVIIQYEFQLYHGLQSSPTDGFQALNSSGVALK